MEYRNLGNTDIKVSVICLGTMTWGQQNNEAQAHQQLEYSLAQGVNFIDTAEMYPVPPRADTQGKTEAFIGSWLAQQSPSLRSKIVLASKVAGPGMMAYLRDGPQLTRQHIEKALNDSLARLQTDYLDLYQVHWPARATNFFGQLGYTHSDEHDATPIAETLEVLDEMVRAGKVRSIGISNETPWGMMRWTDIAQQKQQARIVSIQNPYSLLNRSFEVGAAEVAHRENVGLLAYSPLGFGVLSGKYLDGQRPDGARLTLYEYFDRYNNDNAQSATRRYVEIARNADLDPAQMALAYVNTRSFVTSNIIGATTKEQLKSNIASADIHLSDAVLQEIEQVHTQISNPCP